MFYVCSVALQQLQYLGKYNKKPKKKKEGGEPFKYNKKDYFVDLTHAHTQKDVTISSQILFN